MVLDAFDAELEHFPAGTAQRIRRWADRGRAHYSSASEYVCELIRADEKRKAEERLGARPGNGYLAGPEGAVER